MQIMVHFQMQDNTMNWQPLVYWYGKDGFGDVKKAIDQALHKLPEIAQRATGSFCTAGLKQDVCPMEIMHGMMHRH